MKARSLETLDSFRTVQVRNLVSKKVKSVAEKSNQWFYQFFHL